MSCGVLRMGKSQRAKGANAEREVANLLKEYGYEAKRGQVFNHQPDVICDELPIHIEVKRQEQIRLNDWFAQSEEQSRGKIPSVVFRQSRKPWMIALKFEDFLNLLRGEK